MRVYISGPITGTKNYTKRFEHAAEKLKKLGADYINPAHMAKTMPDASHEDYMNIALKLMGKCDAVVILPGAWDSEGCRRELKEAQKLGLPIYYDLEGEQPLYEDATAL